MSGMAQVDLEFCEEGYKYIMNARSYISALNVFVVNRLYSGSSIYKNIRSSYIIYA
jgi:hypothetical protein